MFGMTRPIHACVPMAAALVAAVVLSAPGLAAAQSNGCPAFDRPTVQVDFQAAPLGRDDTRSTAQLAGLPGRAPGPAGASGGNILGLAHAKYGEQSQLGAVFQPQRDGSVCAAVSSVKVTFGFIERVVYVARELPRGSCIHGEVLAHEMKHVATDEALLKEFQPEIRRRIETAAARLGTVRARSQQQAVQALRRPLDAALKGLLQEFSRNRDDRQARVDTIQEYQRVSRSCGGELGKYIKGKAKL
ncbi:MAG TPA: hypothetical protein VD995_11225 [Azospirillum sp.]|nr:hypothetical protein [Azospirillum sp.]